MELEFLLHQVDNGYDFEQLNGFELVLNLIDSGNDDVIKEAEWCSFYPLLITNLALLHHIRINFAFHYLYSLAFES